MAIAIGDEAFLATTVGKTMWQRGADEMRWRLMRSPDLILQLPSAKLAAGGLSYWKWRIVPRPPSNPPLVQLVALRVA